MEAATSLNKRLIQLEQEKNIEEVCKKTYEQLFKKESYKNAKTGL
jgi:hypothetical protein